MKRPFEVAPETFILPSSLPVPLPGFGHVPINSYLIKSREPVLIDAGMAIEKEEWLKTLESLIDPKELKWIWITHDDADHTGNIQDVLRMAPKRKNRHQHYRCGSHGDGLADPFGPVLPDEAGRDPGRR